MSTLSCHRDSISHTLALKRKHEVDSELNVLVNATEVAVRRKQRDFSKPSTLEWKTNCIIKNLDIWLNSQRGESVLLSDSCLHEKGWPETRCDFISTLIGDGAKTFSFLLSTGHWRSIVKPNEPSL